MSKHLHEREGNGSINKEARNKKVRLFSLFIIIAFFLCIITIFEFTYRDKFYPGVYLGDKPIGGQTYEEVLNHYKEKALIINRDGLNATFETGKNIEIANIPMFTTGLTPDTSIEYFTLGNIEDDLNKAYNYGRGKNILYNIKDQIILFFGKRFYFSNIIQKESVEFLLENEIYESFKKSSPAKFVYQNGKIEIVEEESGEYVDKEEVLTELSKKLANLDTIPSTFKVNIDNPTITKTRLAPFGDFAEHVAQKTSLELKYKEHKWKINGVKLMEWLVLKDDNTVGIDIIKIKDYLTSTVQKSVDNPPVNSRFEIQNGKLVEIVPGKKGYIVDTEKIIGKIEIIMKEIEKSFTSNISSTTALDTIKTKLNFSFQNETIYLPIDTVEVEPKITKETIQEYDLKDLVGKISTGFTGSSTDREHNIKIGASVINGMLIAPGEEFSTVSAIGSVTEKEGYVKELVIKGNKTEKEFGGGLCQIATTLFRLALNAGLPVTERMNHRFTVHYYDPPGLDATIYGPHPDFRFVNDTSGYLLLQARVENKRVIMELYGQKDERTVKISEPVVYDKIPASPTKFTNSADLTLGEMKCYEAPHDGLTTEVLYTVTYPNGDKKEKNFKSIYQPWQKICLVGTAIPI